MTHSSVVKLMDSYQDKEWHPFLDAIRDQSGRSETTAEDVLSALEKMDLEEQWSREDVISCFKEMHAFGFARMIKGVRTRKTRLEWLFPPRIVAAAALGETKELEQLMEGQPLVTPSEEEAFVGKCEWTQADLMALLTTVTGLEEEEIQLRFTIPEARKILAAGQDISVDDVLIRLG